MAQFAQPRKGALNLHAPTEFYICYNTVMDYPTFEINYSEVVVGSNEPIAEIEIDDSLVLEDSNAFTGARILGGKQATECEVFLRQSRDGCAIEVYPLDGNEEPLCFFARGCYPQNNDSVLARAIQQGLSASDIIGATG